MEFWVSGFKVLGVSLMNLFKHVTTILILSIISSFGICAEPDSSLPGISEHYLFKRLETFESVKADQSNAIEGQRWQLRSQHIVFGMPGLTDDRHDFKPEGMKKNSQESLCSSGKDSSSHISTA